MINVKQVVNYISQDNTVETMRWRQLYCKIAKWGKLPIYGVNDPILQSGKISRNAIGGVRVGNGVTQVTGTI